MLIIKYDKHKSNKYHKYETLIYPFLNINSHIIELLKKIGMSNILDCLELLDAKLYNFSDKSKQLLEFYDDLFSSYQIEILNNYELNDYEKNLISKNSEFYTTKIFIKKEMEKKNKKEELLFNNFTLMINYNNNNWICFHGYFNNDPLLFSIKSHGYYDRISNNLIERKNEIMISIKDADVFKKQHMKYIEVWELITMNVDELKTYINDKHKKFIEINNKSFATLMKDFELML